MSRVLPPLDMHAHVEVTLAEKALEELGAVIFAVTRTLDEFTHVMERADLATIWGVGCHPGLDDALERFDSARFQSMLAYTPFVGEVGVDGRSRVPIEHQTRILDQILQCVKRENRIVSVHSSGATRVVIDCVETAPSPGIVLHWWRGTADETRRAIDAGCYFSVNQSVTTRQLSYIPIDRVLTETDHPYGDRRGSFPRQPGAVTDTESILATHYSLDQGSVRRHVWSNLATLIARIEVHPMLPRPVQLMLRVAAG